VLFHVRNAKFDSLQREAIPRSSESRRYMCNAIYLSSVASYAVLTFRPLVVFVKVCKKVIMV